MLKICSGFVLTRFPSLLSDWFYLLEIPSPFDMTLNVNCWADDSWINITPEQLDAMLNNAYGQSTAPTSDTGKVAERMKAFVEKMSSHEGAEFPGSVTCKFKLKFVIGVHLWALLVFFRNSAWD